MSAGMGYSSRPILYDDPHVGYTNLFNFYAHNPIRGDHASTTNAYAFYAQDITIASSTNYGLYISGATNNNYIANNLGVGSTTPWGLLSVDQVPGRSSLKPVFVVGDNGTTSPFMFVSQKGVVGFGTSTPTDLLLNPGDVAIGRNGVTNDLYVSGGLGVGNATTSDSDLAIGDDFYFYNNRRFGIGTTSPSATLSIGNPSTGSTPHNAIYVATTTANHTKSALVQIGKSLRSNYYSWSENGGGGTTLGINRGCFGSGVFGVGDCNLLAIETTYALADLRYEMFSVSSIAGLYPVVGIGTSSPALVGSNMGMFAVGGGSTGVTLDTYISGGLGVGNATTADSAIEAGRGTSPGRIIGRLVNEFGGVNTVNAVCHGAADIDSATAGAYRPLVACTTDAIDVAEWYPAENGVEPGDIVSLSSGYVDYTSKRIDALTGTLTEEMLDNHTPILKKSFGPYNTKIIGVISTSPVQTYGRGVIQHSENPQPVAIAGRLPVKVSNENGSIQQGDRITSSHLPGVGMKATEEGTTVGIALAPFDGSTGFSAAVAIEDPATGVVEYRDVVVGQVMVFINIEWNHLDTQFAGGNATSSDFWLIDQQSGRLATAFDLDLGGHSIENIKSIASASGNWSLDENGYFVVKDIDAGSITTDALTVGEVSKPNGVTLYDTQGGAPYCVYVSGGVVQTILGKCEDQTGIFSGTAPDDGLASAPSVPASSGGSSSGTAPDGGQATVADSTTPTTDLGIATSDGPTTLTDSNTVATDTTTISPDTTTQQPTSDSSTVVTETEPPLPPPNDNVTQDTTPPSQPDGPITQDSPPISLEPPMT